MKTLEARIGSIEERVGRMPIPWGALPMSLGEFIRLDWDLAAAVEHLALRAIGERPEIQAWERDQITVERCRQLIEAVAAEDVKARAAGRPLPSSGSMGMVAEQARKFIEEREAERQDAATDPQGVR
jgi:hypothetical protein